MRELVFDVNEQIIKKNENCDFENLVSGTKGYLKARFSFNKEWNGYGKVAVFTNLSKDYPAILKDNACMIPEEALTGDYFKVKVVGSRLGLRITTNQVTVEQRRDNKWT